MFAHNVFSGMPRCLQAFFSHRNTDKDLIEAIEIQMEEGEDCSWSHMSTRYCLSQELSALLDSLHTLTGLKRIIVNLPSFWYGEIEQKEILASLKRDFEEGVEGLSAVEFVLAFDQV
jgi:hypothetical protein